MANKERGGLDVDSFESFNKALLLKCKYHFLNNPETLSCKLVKTLHGRHRGFDSGDVSTSNKGVWASTIDTINWLHEAAIIQREAMQRKIGDGA